MFNNIYKKDIVTVLLIAITFLPVSVFSFKSLADAEKTYVLEKGKPMVYLRNVCEKIGTSIEWDNITKGIVLKKGTVKIELYVDSNEIYVNDECKTIKGNMHIKDGKALVPLDFPWNYLNASVNMADNKKSLSIKKGSVIFFGDSITQNFKLNNYFKGANVLNKGVSGNRTSDALKRINVVTDNKPDKVFIMLGTNDLWESTDIEVTMENYGKIITEIRTKCPYADIIIQSVMPFGKNATARNPLATNDAVNRLNTRLQEMVDVYGLTYIDVGRLYKNSEGKLNSKYSSDGIHISYSSYKLWADYIRNQI